MPKQIGRSIKQVDLRAAKPIPKKADPELLTKEHQVWRAAVLRLAGHRCQAIENGKRCAVAAPSRLFADHIIERKDGDPFDVRNGQCLCGMHHSLKTADERAKRMAIRY
ncbi:MULTISPECIES: HNH endonuclease signature motif containing protein [unclassified Mesorhizobium]|uniref:HNH endonuclease signature motif containing protein n=1 Tax=unclassified Mesorhizobium TaxID=325217 RepID=UPI000FDC051B|nr:MULTISPECIES: HNH endonuclease signature motif containing protein [unclassified Mesorhizobium]TGT76736.1 HNH endonuclease [Mesorhizobium sp. M2E.F.Ca.ET.166.01.1.1]TGW02848.1 HNH endonuclease [Mesorhizobium sp. M2E.F.Ca.ET.154.01.1.1]